jgi:hypothetical protein
MPLHNRFGFHQEERTFPIRPYSTDGNPEAAIQSGQLGSPILSLQHRDLLPESQVLQQQSSSTPKKTNDDSKRKSDEAEHGAFVADSGLRKFPMLLISRHNVILANDSYFV